MKFKPGDKVICISPYLDYIVGKTYEVINYKNWGPGYETVCSENNDQIVNNKTVNVHFELVEESKILMQKDKPSAASGWGF